MREGPILDGTGTGTESEAYETEPVDTSREGIARLLGIEPEDVQLAEEPGQVGTTGRESAEERDRVRQEGREPEEREEDAGSGRRAA